MQYIFPALVATRLIAAFAAQFLSARRHVTLRWGGLAEDFVIPTYTCFVLTHGSEVEYLVDESFAVMLVGHLLRTANKY